MRLKNVSHSVNDIYWFVLPLILPGLLQRYNLSYSKAGGILTLFLAVAGVGSFLSGKISDSLGRKQILGFGFILSAVGFIAAGFAPSYTLFMGIITITAIGVSTFHPVMYAVIDETVTANKGKTLGIYEAFGTGAVLLMYLINGFLITRIGIRGVLVVTALPAVVMGSIFLGVKSILPAAHRKAASDKTVKKDPALFILFLLFMAAVVARVFTVMAVMNFLPLLFVKYLGFSQNAAVYVSGLFFAGGIIGSVFVGRLSDRMDSVVILIFGSLLIVLCIAVLSLNVPVFLYPAAVFVLGLAGSAAFVNQNLLTTKLGNHLGKGESFGVLMGAITLTGAVSPALFGMSIDAWGFSKSLLLFLIPSVIGIVLLLLVKIRMKTLTLKV